MNPDYPLEQKLIIPAQAGFQLIGARLARMGGLLFNSQQSSRSGPTLRLCPLRGVFISLDSRLRGITSHLATVFWLLSGMAISSGLGVVLSHLSPILNSSISCFINDSLMDCF